MKSIGGKDFARTFERQGWQLRRINGSHHIFTKSGNPARISLPIHGNETPKIGLLRHLMKFAGIDDIES